MTLEVIDGYKSSSNFNINPTLTLLEDPLMLPLQIAWISLSLSIFFSFYLPISLSKSDPLITPNANLWAFSSLFSFEKHTFLSFLYLLKINERVQYFTKLTLIIKVFVISILGFRDLFLHQRELKNIEPKDC